MGFGEFTVHLADGSTLGPFPGSALAGFTLHESRRMVARKMLEQAADDGREWAIDRMKGETENGRS